MSGHCNLFRPRGVKITCFEYLCIENFMTQLFTRLYKDYESYFSRNERSLQSIYAFASPNSMLLRIFVSGVFTTQLFTISYKHYQICFFLNEGSQQSFRTWECPNNMLLRTFVWNVLGHNFSQDCTNIEKVYFFVISGQGNLFRPWGDQIKCFEYLRIERFSTRLFARTTKIMKISFFVQAIIAIFLCLRDSKQPVIENICIESFYDTTFHNIVQTL